MRIYQKRTMAMRDIKSDEYKQSKKNDHLREH